MGSNSIMHENEPILTRSREENNIWEEKKEKFKGQIRVFIHNFVLEVYFFQSVLLKKCTFLKTNPKNL